MHRRTFLGGLSGLGLGFANLGARPRRWTRPRFSASPFSLGVASGDPLPDGVVLWTRLAPDPLEGGGMPAEDVEVEWVLAADESLATVVRRGTGLARATLGHSVHVEVDGLAPDRWYWYRFWVGNEESPVGRTRTTPALDAQVDRWSFAFASCQHYEQGYFTAYRHMVEEDVSLVVHLGDYIYEGPGQDGLVRKHVGDELFTLDDYRTRYALYRGDPDLQAAHAAFPWVVTWDDHEVDNNYAGPHSERHDPAEAFLRRRAGAYQAYYEHMPLRRATRPAGPDMRLYREVPVGNLARLFVMDTRQYRTDQPCGDRLKTPCPEVYDAEATMMGPAQEAWLRDGLDRSPARWNVLAQQVLMASVDRTPGPGEQYGMDQWAGYEAARRRLMQDLARPRDGDPIVLTGDIHSNWVNDLKLDFADPSSPTVATEFVGTSISSGGDGGAFNRIDAIVGDNPFVKYFNGQRGYVRCRLTRDRWQADYRTMEYVSRPGGPIATGASFVVRHGAPGAERA